MIMIGLWDNEFEMFINAELRTGKYSSICELLGLEHRMWFDEVIRITEASLHGSTLLPDTPELCTRRTDWSPIGGLTANAQELPYTDKSKVDPMSWPYAPEAEVSMGDGYVSVKYAGITTQVPYEDYGDDILPAWPEDLGLHGKVRKDSLPSCIRIRAAYPAELVISLAKSEEQLYNLLAEAGYVEAFWMEKDDLERIAIIVLALLKHHKAWLRNRNSTT